MPWFEPSLYDLEYWGQTAIEYRQAAQVAEDAKWQPGGDKLYLLAEGKHLGSGRAN